MIDEVIDLIEVEKSEANTNLAKVNIMLKKQKIFGKELVTIINSGIKNANATENQEERINELVKALSEINILLTSDLKNMENLIIKFSTELELLNKLTVEINEKNNPEIVSEGDDD